MNLFGGPARARPRVNASKLKTTFGDRICIEYAKELVWDGKLDILDGSEPHQHHIFEVQTNRVERLVGKVDVVVTDATLMNSLVLG